MTRALNLVFPLKRDAATQTGLEALAGQFANKVQPALDAALREAQLVHFARVVPIGTEYLGAGLLR